jgi:hypothetical protein
LLHTLGHFVVYLCYTVVVAATSTTVDRFPRSEMWDLQNPHPEFLGLAERLQGLIKFTLVTVKAKYKIRSEQKNIHENDPVHVKHGAHSSRHGLEKHH